MAKSVLIMQGQYFVGNKDYVVNTLLGSCVSIILWHPVKKIGAMSHCLSPTRQIGQPPPLDAKYCDEAIKIMIHELKLLGIDSQQCHAKIFGGAALNTDYKTFQMGAKNVEVTINELKKYGIPIIAKNVLGNKHRRIIFDIENGKVLCSH